MKTKFFLLLLLLAPLSLYAAVSPVETVSKIGDKLIRETPFKYRLTLPTNNKLFNNVHFVDFGRTYGLGKPAVAYAYTELIAATDTLMQIEIEHNDACKVWCNDALVYEKKGQRPLHLVREERGVQMSSHFPVTLKKGRNKILIKSETYGNEWSVFIQPPSDNEAVVNYVLQYPSIGLQQVPDVDKKIAELTNWLVIGPFPAGIDAVNPPEKEFRFGYLYNSTTWSIPKVEILGDVIDPAPWGTTYQWNYHNGGVAWAMQQLTELTNNRKYALWANNFCDYQMEGMPFVKYQVEELKAVHSANNTVLDSRLLDFTLAPSLPLIYRLRKESDFKNRNLYQAYIDKIMDYARFGQIRSKGLTNYTRETPEQYTTWVDDMFMGIPFLMQAGLYAESPELKKAFFDDAAAQVLDFNKHVWDKDAKLYMHANYSNRPQVKLPHWSRANGWAIWAMTEVLMYLPKDHPKYKAILNQYKTHVNSLVSYQDESGFWFNVIDHPESPKEVSGTAIFTMAIARGINHGWLDAKKYKPVALKGWEAIASEIEDDGTVHKICVGTMCSEDVNYYINRPFYDNDTHGSFAVLFAGIEVQKLFPTSCTNVIANEVKQSSTVKSGLLRSTRNDDPTFGVGSSLRRAEASTNFVPVKLSQAEIAYLKKDLQEKDKQYDPAAKMLSSITQSTHYHSDLDSGQVVHQTRESLEYAVALLKTEDEMYKQRAVDIIKTVLPMQEKDTTLPYCGIWPYYPEDPLKTRTAAVDYNWADFIAVPLIDVIINHSDYVGEKLVQEIKEALILAAQSIEKRNVQPDYTNICIMGTYVCYIVGDICHLPEMNDYARKRLRNFYEYTVWNGGFIEYNSPTYTLVAMDELLRMQQTIVNPEDKQMIDDLYSMTWDLIARHFHQPSGQWCGPNLRSYTSLANMDYYRLLYNASNGTIELPGDYPRIPNVIKPHKIPANILPKFTQSFLPRVEIDTFVVAENPQQKDIVGKLYAAQSFALASVNQGYMWNQTRPLIAHWGTPDNSSYLRVRFLHDGYDFSAVNIACVQDTTTVLAIFNIADDGGDTHPGLDRIQNATIEASDLRLRIEVGGDWTNAGFTLPDETDGYVHFVSPEVKTAIQVPYAEWDGNKGHWEKRNDAQTIGVDYVLYSGENKTFRLDKMREAVLGLHLVLSADDAILVKNNAIQVEKKNDYLTLSNDRLMVKALAKPDKEERLKNDYETSSKGYINLSLYGK